MQNNTEITQHAGFNSETGAAAGKKSKRGKGRKTIYKEAFENGLLTADGEVISKYIDTVMAGKAGNEAKAEMMKMFVQYELDTIKARQVNEHKNELQKELFEHKHSITDIDKVHTLAVREYVNRMSDSALEDYIEQLQGDEDAQEEN